MSEDDDYCIVLSEDDDNCIVLSEDDDDCIGEKQRVGVWTSGWSSEGKKSAVERE